MVLSYGQESNPEKADIEVAWPVDGPKLSNATLPAATAAVTMHIGPCDDLSHAYNDPSSVPPEHWRPGSSSR